MRTVIIGHSRSGTTITRDILSEHPKVWITNQMRIYGYAARYKSAGNYFKALSGKTGSYRKLPFEISKQQFVKRCKKNFVGSGNGLLDRVRAVEKTLFKDYEIYGDKTDPHIIGKTILEVDAKIIYIFRDGRDVVASGLRHYKDPAARRQEWSRSSAYKNSKFWAETKFLWNEIKKDLNPKDFVELKFEDYVDNPKRTADKIFALLNIDIFSVTKQLIKKEEAHIGNYRRWCPNWRKEFHPDAVDFLEKLGYI